MSPFVHCTIQTASLRLFVKTSHEHPLSPIEEMPGLVEIARWSWIETTQSPYSENISNDVKTAVAGFTHDFYSMPRLALAKQPPKSCEPIFTPHSAAHLTRRYRAKGSAYFPLQSYSTATQAEHMDDYEHWQPKSQDVAVRCFPEWVMPHQNQRVLCGEVSLVDSV